MRTPSVTVYHRKRRGGAYVVRWRENGRQHESSPYQTREEAEAAAHTLRQQLRQSVSRTREVRTIGSLAAEWWDKYVEHSVQAGTRYNYRSSVRRILDDLGDEPINNVSSARIHRWHHDLLESVSPRTANATLTALSSILQRGVEWGYLTQNPARGVKRHKEPRQNLIIPTREDIARLGMTAPSNRERGMLLVAAYSGIRFGELRALRASDMAKGRLRISAAVGADAKIKETKTGGIRFVPIPGSVAEWLREYSAGMPGEALLFGEASGAVLNPGRWARQVFRPWQEAAGTEIQWRMLRHYYASQLAAIGATILQCSRWMGHGSAQTTMDRYAFLFDEDESGVMQRLADR